MIEIGRILKPQGTRGEMKAQLYSDNFEGFARRGYVYIKQNGDLRRIGYAVTRTAPPFLFLRIAGVATRSNAEVFSGVPMLLHRTEFETPESGEYYIVDLIGLKVVDEHGAELGILKDVLQHGAADVYVVRGAQSFMFPALKRVITGVDLEEGVIRLNAEALAEVAVYDVV
jgi:16S rRNA processing protein RimM